MEPSRPRLFKSTCPYQHTRHFEDSLNRAERELHAQLLIKSATSKSRNDGNFTTANTAHHIDNPPHKATTTIPNADTNGVASPKMTILTSAVHDQDGPPSGPDEPHAPVADTNQAARRFHFFKLPTEIRFMIWALVDSEPRVVTAAARAPGFCRCGRCPARCTFATAGTRQPLLSRVCVESRAFLQTYAKMVLGEGGKPGLWWNPGRDTLRFPMGSRWPRQGGLNSMLSTLNGFEHIQYIVVGYHGRTEFDCIIRRNGGRPMTWTAWSSNSRAKRCQHVSVRRSQKGKGEITMEFAECDRTTRP